MPKVTSRRGPKDRRIEEEALMQQDGCRLDTRKNFLIMRVSRFNEQMTGMLAFSGLTFGSFANF